jgi:hypothetical protein
MRAELVEARAAVASDSPVSEVAAYHLVCPSPANPNSRSPGWLSTFPSVTWTVPSTMR